jgi:hypothetical protein
VLVYAVEVPRQMNAVSAMVMDHPAFTLLFNLQNKEFTILAVRRWVVLIL